jgi:hypothetical protein
LILYFGRLAVSRHNPAQTYAPTTERRKKLCPVVQDDGALSEELRQGPGETSGFTEEFYKNLCAGKLAAVLETLEYLKHETNVWFEITTLLIPGKNDSAEEIAA